MQLTATNNTGTQGSVWGSDAPVLGPVGDSKSILTDDIGHGTPSTPAPVSVSAPPPASLPSCTSLSPDSLLAYCQTRLQSLDSQMTNIFNSQTQNANTTSAINAVANQLNDLPAPDGSGSVAVSWADAGQIESAYNAAIAAAEGPHGVATPLSTSLSNDLASFEAAFGNPASGSGSIPSDTMTQLTGNLKTDTSTLNSDSQMTMITLQSLMSQRETAVQLTTNLVQSLGDQSNDVAKNVGA